MKRICATCRFAEGFTTGPGISGAEEGVKCSNLEFAKYLDRLQNDASYEQEFHKYGFINVFRVEAVASAEGEECQYWEGTKHRGKKGTG